MKISEILKNNKITLSMEVFPPKTSTAFETVNKAVKEIAALKPVFIKIPSACNNHYEMLDWLCDHYDGEIHVSLGMTTHEEDEKLIQLFEQ